MESLDAYALEFEDMPLKLSKTAGRISVKKMSKESPTPAPVKAKYAKTKGEHNKDLIIAVLVAGIIAFVGGMTFQARQQDAINTAVKGVQTVAPAEVKK